MFKKTVSLLLGILLLTGCTSASVPAAFLKQVPLQASVKKVDVPQDIRQSLFELTSEITPDYFKESKKANQIFSPLSLWYALGVLREGASGETKAEIGRMMKLTGDFSSDKVIPDLSSALNFMEESKIAQDKSKHGIRLTNGIFFDQRYAKNLKDSFLEKAASVWGTETAQVDFMKEAETKKLIQDWVSGKTDGFISDYEATFKTDGTAILNIYNVLYLKDLWLTKFHRLENEVFHAPQGDVTVPFFGKMVEGAHYNDHASAQAVAFDGEKGIRVWFLLPKAGRQPSDLIPDLADILKEGTPSLVNFKAPVLDIDGENLSLKDLLQKKGYATLFDDADLSGMLDDKVDAVVSEIKQKTKLQMDEKGFKAAAVTEIGVDRTSMPAGEIVEFSADRPYLMVIEYQGLPLFVSQINDPKAD